MLKVGVSEVNITPELGLRMSGMPNAPVASGVQWPLMARAIVFEDDAGGRAAIVSLDLLSLAPETAIELRTAVVTGTPLLPEQVMVACSHTHRGPYTRAGMDEEANWEYLQLLRARLVSAVTTAWTSRRPARIKRGSVQAPGWTFNRRPVYKSDRGEQVGTQGPCYGPDFVRMESPADEQLQVLLAEDAGGRPLCGLVNYASHATVMGGEPVYSADWPGAMTEALAERLGAPFGFLQGATGNQWPVDRTKPGPITERGPDHARKMGSALADRAIHAVAGANTTELPLVRTASRVLSIPQRKVTKEQVDLARWYLEVAKPGVDQKAFTRRLTGRDFTFYDNHAYIQTWFCRELLGAWELQRHASTPDPSEEVEVHAIAIGDLAIVGFPCEYFSEFGMRIKAESPFRQTFVVELANGAHGYVPTREAHEHGGYEPRLKMTSCLVPGAGERMCDAALQMLVELERGGR